MTNFIGGGAGQKHGLAILPLSIGGSLPPLLPGHGGAALICGNTYPQTFSTLFRWKTLPVTMDGELPVTTPVWQDAGVADAIPTLLVPNRAGKSCFGGSDRVRSSPKWLRKNWLMAEHRMYRNKQFSGKSLEKNSGKLRPTLPEVP